MTDENDSSLFLGRLMRAAMQDPPAQEAPAPAPGPHVGRFVLQHVLGSGGMGEVWKAWDPDLRRWVAIKLLKEDGGCNWERFEREARTAARLNHPNIAAIYEVGKHAGRPYIAMQYVEGRPLSRLSQGEPRILAQILRDAALTVHAAHEQGIVHRDLKPANLMVESSATGPRVYVLDFGLAKEAAVDSSLSATGTLLGTPSYMSPEQALGRIHEVDRRSDVYSLGVTLYELLAGRLPFSSPTMYRLIKRIVEEEPAPLRRWRASVSPDLERIVLKCLEKDPARRYPTALALAEDLGRWLSGEAILAQPPTMGYRLRRFARRRRVEIGTALVSLAVLAVVGTLFVTKWSRARSEGQRLARENERQLEAAREEAQSRERSLKELSILWTELRLAKAGLYQPSEDATRVRERIRGAVDRISSYVARNPDSPQGYYVRAYGWLFLYDLERASADASKAAELAPAFRPAEILRTYVFLQQFSESHLGVVLIGQSNIAHFGSISVRQLDEWLERFSGVNSANQIAGNDWGLAETEEERVLASLVEVLQAHQRKHDDARASESLRQLDDKNPSEIYRLWRALLTDDAQEVIRTCDAAIKRMPLNAWPYLFRGQAYQALVKLREASDDLDLAIALGLRRPSSYLNRASARMEFGDPDKAQEDLADAIRLGADPRYATFLRARILEKRGKQDEALVEYGRAIELDPGFAAAYARRGCLYAQREQLQEALRDLDKAIDLDPESSQAHLNRGLVYSFMDDLEHALRDLRTAVKLDPKDPHAHSNLAAIWMLKREFARAVDAASEALRLDPNNLEALENRAEAHHALGNRDKAIDDYTALLRLAPPDWKHRSEVESKLAELRP